MNTHTETISDLEELLDAEIPCGGIKQPEIARFCTRAAMLVSHSHGCASWYKCVSCWQIWYRNQMEYLMAMSCIRCKYCRKTFHTIEDFSDYRPL